MDVDDLVWTKGCGHSVLYKKLVLIMKFYTLLNSSHASVKSQTSFFFFSSFSR